MKFGSEGDTEFVSATNDDGEQVSLSWNEPLPAPVVEETTVRYPEVLADVDLEVYSKVDSFSYALVVRTPEAAEDAGLERVEVGVQTQGLSVAANEASDTAWLSDESNDTSFIVERPWMWDSSESDGGVPQRAAAMDLEMDSDSLAVVPDAAFLSDPEVEYPVYIDPEFVDLGASFENAWSQGTGIQCGNSGTKMCTGRQTWQYDGSYGHWRSAMKFSGLDVMANRDVQQANVWIRQNHTGDAGGPNQTVRLAAMNYFDTTKDITWDNFNDLIIGEVARDSVPTSNDDAGESDQTIEWTGSKIANRIQYQVNRGKNTALFAVISGKNWEEESSRDFWRKLDPATAKLKVWHAPLKPFSLDTEGQDCSTSSPGPVINTTTPTFQATSPKALESDNILKFYVYERDGVPDKHLKKIEVSDVAENQSIDVTVPSGVLERGKTYRWNSRVQDTDSGSTRYGEFTSYCYFTINALPQTPTDLSVEELECGTKSDPTLVTTREPKLSATPQDPDGGNLRTMYRLFTSSGALMEEWIVDAKAGVAAIDRIDAGAIPTDGTYQWKAVTIDQFTSSSWSASCWMRVDTTAPEPPDVVQVSENPQPGGEVSFELVGGDDVTDFEYVLEGQSKQNVSATAGRADITVTASTSSIDHVLKAWAKDSAGNTSSPTTHWFTTIEEQAVEAVGAWRFDGDGDDDSGTDHEVDSVDTLNFGADRFDRSGAALNLDGDESQCAVTSSSVLDTTDSYTVAAWVRPEADPAGSFSVLFSQGGQNRPAFYLDWLKSKGQWNFTLPSVDAVETEWVSALSADGPEVGTWQHVAAVYDAPAERIRLYVDGALQSSTPLTYNTWQSDGPLAIGCEVTADGTVRASGDMSIDEAMVFQDVLIGDQISELMAGDLMPASLRAWYPLRGDGADHSSNGNDLAGMPDSPTWMPDQYGRADSALSFDGTSCPSAGVVPVRTDAAFTVSAWVNLDSDHASAQPRVFSFHGDQFFSTELKYDSTSGQWNVGVTESDSPDADRGEGVVGSEITAPAIWVQLAVTVDPDNNFIGLYIDGDLVDEGSIATDWSSWRAPGVTLGCGLDEAGEMAGHWDGSMSDVRFWRGALSPDEVATTRVKRLSNWELNQEHEGADQWGTADSTLHGDEGEDYSWEVDRYNECWAAYGLALDDTGYASTADSVVRTDESFTVSAWVKLDARDSNQVVVSQTTDQEASFYLAYYARTDKWQFALKDMDGDTASWTTVDSLETPEIGRWYHVAGAYDLGSNKISLYVDGSLVAQDHGPAHPWHGDGQFLLGAAGDAEGDRWSYMSGALDEVRVWSGVLDQFAIADMASEGQNYEPNPDDADCADSGQPGVD
ncbi:LamG domain-containing protein [Salininema proteolyticum]|uniref:LamG domain-containing protein n=1 Tax=Salininema proteolyticum TaxID=1607685 RepID=A0ABV8U0G7_9ACTN